MKLSKHLLLAIPLSSILSCSENVENYLSDETIFGIKLGGNANTELNKLYSNLDQDGSYEVVNLNNYSEAVRGYVTPIICWSAKGDTLLYGIEVAMHDPGNFGIPTDQFMNPVANAKDYFSITENERDELITLYTNKYGECEELTNINEYENTHDRNIHLTWGEQEFYKWNLETFTVNLTFTTNENFGSIPLIKPVCTYFPPHETSEEMIRISNEYTSKNNSKI